MTDSFSSAYDSARNLLRRCWRWLVDAPDKIPCKTMADSSSSIYDSARNFLRRHRRWLAVAFVLYFIVGDYLAVFLGYAETVTETVIENGESVGKETTSWLSPGARLLRDLLIAAAAFFGIEMAYRRNRALDRQANATFRQANASRDRIAGEQFSGAAKLLAQKDAENKPAIDARIGGIYSLQTLANNRIAEYGAQVVKTLIAYIKQNAQLTAQPPLKENETPKEARALGEDVKTAFNVLEQLLTTREKDSAEWNKPPDGIKLSDRDLSFSGQNFSWLDLSIGQVDGLYRYIWRLINLQGANLLGVQLQGVDLSGAQLQGVNLPVAQLEGANLSEAQLQNANLWSAYLQGAALSRAKLQSTNLLMAHLQGAFLSDTQWQGAILSGAQLQGAILSRAQLQNADLSGAQLQGADLLGAQLQGASLIYADLKYADLSSAKLDGKTRLPDNLSGKIWHSGQPELSGIVPPPPDAEWDLEPFMDSAYALDFVLRRHALRLMITKVKSEDAMRAKKFRVAARKLLDKEKLPEGFPEDWRDWLAEVKADGSHPDDSKFSG